MYKKIRTLHLCLGLFVTPFLLIYAISSAFYSHGFLNISSTKTYQKEFLLASMSNNPNNVALILLKNHGIRGSLINSSITDEDQMKLNISRPGVSYNIIYDMNSGLVNSTESIKDNIGFIASLHQAGFHDKNSIESYWSDVIKLVSVLLVFVVLSGLFLWLFHSKNKLASKAFFIVTVVYCITVLFVLRLG